MSWELPFTSRFVPPVTIKSYARNRASIEVGITDCAQSGMLYCAHMTTEKPTVISPRVYKKHRKMIKQLKRKMKCSSEAQVVREAIERLHRDFEFAD